MYVFLFGKSKFPNHKKGGLVGICYQFLRLLLIFPVFFPTNFNHPHSIHEIWEGNIHISQQSSGDMQVGVRLYMAVVA